jgi:hypothetical protein
VPSAREPDGQLPGLLAVIDGFMQNITDWIERFRVRLRSRATPGGRPDDGTGR